MSIHEQMRIVSVNWYIHSGSVRPIGIIVAEYRDTKCRKAFIGTGEGYDPDLDARHILETGAKLYLPELERLRETLAVQPASSGP